MKLQLKALTQTRSLVSLLAFGTFSTACVATSVDPPAEEEDTVAPGDGDGDGDGDDGDGDTTVPGAGGMTISGGSGGAFGSGGMVDEPLAVEAYLPMTVTDYYAASGFMGMENSLLVGVEPVPPDEVEGLTMDPMGCVAEDRPAGAAGECYHVHYEPQYLNCTALELETDPDCENGSTWVGMYFQSPTENWGEAQGTVIEQGAVKVVFTAWTMEGELALNFLAGGIGNLGTAYADTFKVESPQTINATPTQYELSLASANYEDVIAAFGWTIEKQGMDPVDFYIDDIRWVKE